VQALVFINTLFSAIQKRVFSRNLDQNMPKMRIKKWYTNRCRGLRPRTLVGLGGLPNLCGLLLPPTVIALSNVFSAKTCFIAFENTATIANVLLLLFPRFLRLFFHFKLCSFCWWRTGGAKIFLPRAQGTLASHCAFRTNILK